MSPLQQLQFMLNETYVTEDGEEYKIKLKPGLSDQRIDKLAMDLPVPTDIRELLRFAGGFEFYTLDEITFYGGMGLEELFPRAVEVARDGAGNGWIVDIDRNGHWGQVFFVCHDPAVVVLNSNDLTEFLQQLHEYGKNPAGSHLSRIQEQTIFEVWEKRPAFIDIQEARTSSDTVLSEFAAGMPDHFVVADARNQQIGYGFAWGKFGPAIENAVRHETEPIWGVEAKGRSGKAAGTVKADEPGKATGTAKAAGSGGGTSDQPKMKGFFAKLFGR